MTLRYAATAIFSAMCLATMACAASTTRPGGTGDPRSRPPAHSPGGVARGAEGRDSQSSTGGAPAREARQKPPGGQGSPADATPSHTPLVKTTPDVRFVPTPRRAVDLMLEMANIRKDDVLYDLGCGDGRIVIAAAKTHGIKAVGYDIDPKRVAQSRENVKAAGVEHLVTIRQADIFTLDLTGATVITLFLLPRLNVALMPQLHKLKPGSRILSYRFDMKGAKPVMTRGITFGKTRHRLIYKWVVPWSEE